MNNRNVIITLIIFLSVICISLISAMVVLINKDFNFNFGFNFGSWKINLVDSIEEEGSIINKIDLNVYSTDVEIKESKTNNLKIEYYSNKNEDKLIKNENNIISINEEESKTICIGICSNRKRVVIYVPSNYIGSYNIKSTSGDVNSSIDLIENEVDINTTSGDIKLKDITYANIFTTSGNVNINNVNKVNLSTTSGDVFIKGETDKIEIKSTSGDLEVNKVNKYLNLYTVSGKVKINTLNIMEDSLISTTSGDVFINNNESDCYVEFSSMTGDRNINKSNRKSDLILKVNTISGDLNIN